MKKSSQKNNTSNFLSNIFWTVKFIITISPILSVIAILIQVIFNLTPILNSYIFARIFTQLGTLLLQKSSFEVVYKAIVPNLLLLFVTNLGTSILSTVSAYISTILRRKRATMIDQRYATKLLEIDIQQFEESKVMDLMRKAEDNIWNMTNLFNDIVSYFGKLIGGITSIFIIAKLEPLIIVLTAIFTAPIVIKDIFYNKEMRKAYDSQTEKWREYWTGRWLITSKEPLREIKILNTGKRMFNYIFNIRKSHDDEIVGIDKKYTRIDMFSRLAEIGDILSAILVIKKVILLQGTIGDITFNIDQTARVNNFFSVLIRDFIALYDRSKYIQYVKELFDLKPVLVNGKLKISTKKAPEIEFRNVSFKYPNTKRSIIKNLNLTIRPNEEIALVGENGAGKSTIVKLLLRLYDPTEGEILVNGVNIKSYDLSSYYNMIGALLQDYYTVGFFDMKSNIEFAKTNHSTISYTKAAKLADVHSSIEKLPLKYKQKASTYFDNGSELSNGQYQKLVIARLFYRNSPILVLDEPTASIDAIAEAKIFNRIYKFMKNKTVIIISHRFSTVRNAKKIYVLHNGKIVEQGSHEELIKHNGRYAKSFKLQAKGYTGE